MVERIATQFDPEKIFLFGSQARGDANDDSDVDFLVVMDFKGTKIKKMVEIGVALHDFHIPMDILISTPEEFEWRKNYIGTIEWPAVHEGKLLYARAG